MVSIIMPCYNVEKMVGRSIESVLNQTYTDWELILINDGSTDDTEMVLRRYADMDNRIHLLRQKNGGVSKARNTGLNAAKGDYICPLDGDDWFKPDCLALAVDRILDTNSDVCFFGSEEVDEEGKVLRDYLEFAQYPPEEFLKNADALYEKSLRHFWIHTGNALYRRSMIEKHGIRYPEGYRYGEDNHFINTCLFWAERITCVRQTLMCCQCRSGSATRSGVAPSYIDAAKLNRMFRNFLEQHGSPQKALTACDIDYVLLLTASAKNVVDNVPLCGYASAKRQMKSFGILDAPRSLSAEAIQALPKPKRMEWNWFCHHLLFFFVSVKAYRLLKK